MTQIEEVSMTFESNTPAKQMNGADTGRRDQEELSPTSTSPLGRDEASAGSVLAMGSTDSAGNTHGGGPSCGLVSSLFPSSCRGRAEAFARSLHRRLTSLSGENGSQDDFDLSKPNETSWLHSTSIRNDTNNVNHVLDHQPRHSLESELFYDLDRELEENGIGSPAEEATAAELAHLLVNHQSIKINHHDTCPALQRKNYGQCHCSSSGSKSAETSQNSGSDGVSSSPHTGNNTPENGIGSPTESTAEELAHLLIKHQSLEINDHATCCYKPGDQNQDSGSDGVYSSPRTGNNTPENGVDSPDELAHFLTNQNSLKINHHDTYCSAPSGPSQDSGSDVVYLSPQSEDDSPENEESDTYFDPLSSDGERKKDVFFDPVSTSESEGMATLSNGSDHETDGVFRRKLEKIKNHEASKNEEETSESSCSFNTPEISRLRMNAVESTDESSNERSSNDSSHDSLWSTFEDTTLSESPVKNEVFSSTQIRVPKSHSDSELPSCLESNDILTRRIEVVDEDELDEVDFINSTFEETEDRKPTKEDLNLRLENGFKKATRRKSDEDGDDREMVKLGEEFSDNHKDHSTYSTMINIPGALTLDCASGVRIQDQIDSAKNLEELLINDESLLNNSSDESKALQRFDSPDCEVEDEDSRNDLHLASEENQEDEEGHRPPRVRRCSSLKTGKTPPGTPGRKKIVRFADVLGLDLADVRTFLDEIPKIPNSAYSDLIYDDVFHKESSPINCGVQSWSARYLDNNRTNNVVPKSDKTLVPLFQQPGGLPNFLDFVRDRRVCLENVLVSDPVTFCIKGTVRVCNLDFNKSVHIRYTLNSWKSYSDLQATYAPNSCDGFSDKFTFTLYCHTLRVGQRLEFAVRFHCKGAQYWDNNLGANYCFQCLPSSSTVGYIPITAPENAHDWTPMFY